MIVINKKTGKDVSSLFLKYMEGKISKEQFEKLAQVSKHGSQK